MKDRFRPFAQQCMCQTLAITTNQPSLQKNMEPRFHKYSHSLRSNSTHEKRQLNLLLWAKRVVKDEREERLRGILQRNGYIRPDKPLTKKAMLQFIKTHERFFWRVTWPLPMPNKYTKKKEMVAYLLNNVAFVLLNCDLVSTIN